MSDLSEKNKVVVSIFGDDYPITGVADPAHISRVAEFVDSKMKETASQSRIKSRDKVAILTAMSIASELYEKSDRRKKDGAQYNTRLDALVARMDKALAIKTVS